MWLMGEDHTRNVCLNPAPHRRCERSLSFFRKITFTRCSVDARSKGKLPATSAKINQPVLLTWLFKCRLENVHDGRDVFGVFFSRPATEQRNDNKTPNTFNFSFESHGRCATPQRFDVKDERGQCLCWLFKNISARWFVQFNGGFGRFSVGYENSVTICNCLSLALRGLRTPH